MIKMYHFAKSKALMELKEYSWKGKLVARIKFLIS